MFWRDISENDGEEKLGEGGFFLIFFLTFGEFIRITILFCLHD